MSFDARMSQSFGKLLLLVSITHISPSRGREGSAKQDSMVSGRRERGFWIARRRVTGGLK